MINPAYCGEYCVAILLSSICAPETETRTAHVDDCEDVVAPVDSAVEVSTIAHEKAVRGIVIPAFIITLRRMVFSASRAFIRTPY